MLAVEGKADIGIPQYLMGELWSPVSDCKPKSPKVSDELPSTRDEGTNNKLPAHISRGADHHQLRVVLVVSRSRHRPSLLPAAAAFAPREVGTFGAVVLCV
jgi:hypothetical protein